MGGRRNREPLSVFDRIATLLMSLVYVGCRTELIDLLPLRDLGFEPYERESRPEKRDSRGP